MHFRYASAADANKAMQQLDQMDIAGQKITVKIAPMTAGETAQLAAAAARVDLDDEGKLLFTIAKALEYVCDSAQGFCQLHKACLLIKDLDSRKAFSVSC